LIIAAWLAAWEYIPRIPGLAERSHLLDVFFISSPSRVSNRLVDLFTGRHDSVLIWQYVWPSLSSATAGLVIGMIAGGAGGLILSNFRFVSRIFNPFIVAMNAVPRIALIPIVIVIFGPTFSASVILAVMVAFFIAFYNAYEGGLSVAPQLLQNAKVMGASGAQLMLHVRLPTVLAWTLASLPLAAAFSIITVVTGEILTGYAGLGRLIAVADSTVDATLTIAVAVVLSILGLVVVGVAEVLKRRVLHWWIATQQV